MENDFDILLAIAYSFRCVRGWAARCAGRPYAERQYALPERETQDHTHRALVLRPRALLRRDPPLRRRGRRSTTRAARADRPRHLPFSPGPGLLPRRRAPPEPELLDGFARLGKDVVDRRIVGEKAD